MTATNKNSWNFDNSYRKLAGYLYREQAPTPVREAKLVLWNEPLAEELGLSFLSGKEAEVAALFSGNEVPAGAAPIAQAYAGHQFGHFNMLGDGRAVLLGEQITPAGARFDIQLKGSGPTPYSRRGDGRATLSSMLREYLISEAMYHLGIPTSRSLAVVATGEPVYRSPVQSGAVLTRVAGSHIRVGTFEYVRQNDSKEDLQQFMDYVIQRHYPNLSNASQPALQLLSAVMNKQIRLVVEWMRVGFIHGVMNTDNVSIAGETIDYGPCAFMNAYDPNTVFSSIDRNGRYAFGNQPRIAHWNMMAFAGTLLPLVADDEEEATQQVTAILDMFPKRFALAWYTMMLQKIGIQQPQNEDQQLVDELLELMQHHHADYNNLFAALQYDDLPIEPIFNDPKFKDWHKRWQERIATAGKAQALALMAKRNPTYIARNHLVEEVLDAATQGNMEPFQQMLQQLTKPYQHQADEPALQQVPAGFDAAYQTFCGT